ARVGRVPVRLAIVLQPDVSIFYIAMPMLNGVQATRQILRRAPNVRILVVSMYAHEAYVTQVLRAGACGYLLKDSVGTDLLSAVECVADGKSFFSPAVAKVMLDDYVRRMAERGIPDRYESLSEREREVFQLIVEGRANKEIATILGVSPGTIETHRGHIMEKLDAHSAVELVLFAVRRGIIT
ncbi:MAG: DNA-binding response regulator, partial [Acidobacteria bacterium]